MITVSVSAAVPEEPSDDVNSPLVLDSVPDCVAATSTDRVQLDTEETVPPEYETVPVPSAAVSVPPVQVVVALEGVATIIPVGNVSENVNEDAGNDEPELSMVNVSVDTPPASVIGSGEKDLLKPGCGTTVNVSVAVPEFPRLEVRAPDVLTKVPVVALVTLACIVQTELAETEPPVKEIVPLDAVAVSTPPEHVDDAAGDAETTTPAGSVSVKLTDAADSDDPELSMVKVRTDSCPVAIVSALNALANDGGGTITSDAVAALAEN